MDKGAGSNRGIITRHLESIKGIGQSRHGFILNESTGVFENVSRRIDQGVLSDVVYLDFWKVFGKFYLRG